MLCRVSVEFILRDDKFLLCNIIITGCFHGNNVFQLLVTILKFYVYNAHEKHTLLKKKKLLH